MACNCKSSANAKAVVKQKARPMNVKSSENIDSNKANILGGKVFKKPTVKRPIRRIY